jgi:hypothetical protein
MTKLYLIIANSKYANVYPNVQIPIGKFENNWFLPNVIVLHTDVESRFGLPINDETAPPKIKFKLHAINKPTKKMNPFKFCSMIDDNAKKQTNINGAKRKNKYINVMIFNSMVVLYIYISI